MNALLWISASFIYNKVSECTEYLIRKFPHRLIYRNVNKRKKEQNMMYKLFSLISDMFSNIDPRRILKKRKAKQTIYYLEGDQICLNL